MKAIILARVSTKDQMIEGQSIPAQLTRAREYAKRKGLIIKSEYSFDESSIKEHRKKFEKIIEEIKKSKEKVVLIVEAVDRLQRSFKESILLDELIKKDKLEIHFLRENLILNKNSTGAEIQRWDMAVLFAKSYILNISDNVKRSFEYKIKHGEWIGKAPFGYKNVEDINGNRTIIPDPDRAPLVKKIFEMYATGNYSLLQITEEMKKAGLRSKFNKPLHKSVIHHILNNPFYYGMMQVNGRLYPHKYQPLISKFLFDKCQEVMQGYHKKPFKYLAKPFIFRGLIKCKECGCTITPEMHKGHIYYSCTNYKKVHSQKFYIREEKLLDPVSEILKNIRLPEKIVHEITEELRKINQTKNEFYQKELLKLKKECEEIEDRISKTFDLLVDGIITKDIYDKKLKEYKEKLAEIEEKMKIYSSQDENFYLTAEIVLNLCNRTYEIFENSEITEKRQILNFLFQNLQLSGEKLEYSLKEPFNSIVKCKKSSNGLRW